MLDGPYVHFVYMVKCKFHESISLDVELQCQNLFAEALWDALTHLCGQIHTFG